MGECDSAGKEEVNVRSLLALKAKAVGRVDRWTWAFLPFEWRVLENLCF